MVIPRALNISLQIITAPIDNLTPFGYTPGIPTSGLGVREDRVSKTVMSLSQFSGWLAIGGAVRILYSLGCLQVYDVHVVQIQVSTCIQDFFPTWKRGV